MALECELCGKKPSFGNTISHAHNVTRRRWNPNLRRVKAVVEGVRKHVTRHYSYLVYYTVDDEAEEITILTIQHPAREREHSDA